LYGEKGWEKYTLEGKLSFDSMRYDTFMDKLSMEMMIPKKYISIQSSIDIDESSKLKFPFRHSVKRS